MSDQPDDRLRIYLAQRDAATRNATTVYAALKSTGRLSDQRLLAYRCRARGCLLLDIVQVPGQVVIHQPRYKRSPERNLEASNEAGRARNTEDGERRWNAQTFDPASAINFALNCDHLDHVLISRERVQRDLEAGRRLVKIDRGDHETPPRAYSADWS